MSLRLSSLDPNEPRAAKDCRTCNRRRIRCDRSLPTCRKCALKGVQCPGYGLRIQWGQGVASRGKLTGKTLPVLESSSSTPSVEHHHDSPKSSTPTESLDSREGHESSAEPPTVPPSLRTAFEAAANGQPLANGTFSLEGDLSLDQIPLYVQDPIVQKLLRHYDRDVASVMPWVDGPNNTWRTVVIPLGMESPPLLLAILALAAEHYTSKKGSTWSRQHGVRSSEYRDKSLRLLARDLRSEMADDALGQRQGTPSAMLATILILCNMEMIRSDSSLWNVHWKAARTITRRWTSPHHSVMALDPTSRLLIKEAFVYDVFASSTTFDGGDQIPGSVLADEDAGVFTDWMKIIQEVTMAERQRDRGTPKAVHGSSLADIDNLQRRFEYARARSLHFQQGMDFGSAELHHDFEILINIFHYAGLIYSFRALLDVNQIRATMQQLVDHTIQSINQIEERSAFQHDFVWPLFVIGTESRDSPELQDFVEVRILEAMTSTGFSNCFPALQFLQRFWGSHPATAVDWVQFARQESARGFTFLVI